MGAGGTNADWSHCINLIKLLHIWEAGYFRLLMISTFEYLVQIHLCHTLCRFLRVVVVFNVDQ